jgi:hypothetical protein
MCSRFGVQTLVLILLQINCVGAAHSQGQCPRVPSRADYEKSWDEVLRDKRRALDDGIRSLELIKSQLQANYSNTIGEPGGARDSVAAIALVARESADLIDLLATVSGGEPTGAAKEIYGRATKLRRKLDQARSEVEQKIDSSNADMIDAIPTFVPGIKLARDMRDWKSARAAYLKQVAGLQTAIDKLASRLAALGGPQRAHSVSELLEFARADAKSCQMSANPNALPPREPVRTEQPEERPLPPLGHTQPIPGPCRALGTC